jgi:hypothetical protein
VKALLPVWSVVLLAVVATLAGAAVFDAGAPWWAAAAVAFVLSAGTVFVARRVLPRFGAEAYEELPESWFGRRRPGHEMLSDLLNKFAPIVAGILAGLPALALGIGTDPALFDELPAWLICGMCTGWPIYTELDARLAFRFARQNAVEEDELLSRAEQVERTTTAADAEVPLDRRFAWTLAAATLGGGLACAALGVFADDMPDFQRVVVIAGFPFFAFAAWMWARHAVAPYALRVTADGIGVLGRGVVPWTEVEGVDVEAVRGLRHLVIWHTGTLDDRPGLKRLSKIRSGAVAFPLRLCGWPPERVLGTLKAHGVRDVEVSLA